MNKLVISAVEEEKIQKKSQGEIWEKIIDIRNAHSLGRDLFAKEIDTSGNTLKAMEKRRTNPSTKIVQNVCRRWPEYTLWLLLDETNIEMGQISASMKRTLGSKKIFDRDNPNHKKLIKDDHKKIMDMMKGHGRVGLDTEPVARKDKNED